MFRYRLGPVEQSSDFDTNGWERLIEPSLQSFQLMSLPCMLLNMLLVYTCIWLLTDVVPHETWPPNIILATVVVMIAHEFLHGVVYPTVSDGKKSTTLGIRLGWLPALYAHSDAAMTRERRLLAILFPL